MNDENKQNRTKTKQNKQIKNKNQKQNMHIQTVKSCIYIDIFILKSQSTHEIMNYKTCAKSKELKQQIKIMHLPKLFRGYFWSNLN